MCSSNGFNYSCFLSNDKTKIKYLKKAYDLQNMQVSKI
jgi:hypothetical protein